MKFQVETIILELWNMSFIYSRGNSQKKKWNTFTTQRIFNARLKVQSNLTVENSKKSYSLDGTAREVRRKLMQAAPVPWPKMVMLSGSPPNAAMFSLSQCSAAIWSIRPQLVMDLFSGCSFVFRKPVKSKVLLRKCKEEIIMCSRLCSGNL